jgi:hypothetical protein
MPYNNAASLFDCTVGEPVKYTSIYGYPKFKYPVLNGNGVTVGYVKQECIRDDDGNGGLGEWRSPVYYTRDLSRPHGLPRFYGSVEALVIAFGGTMSKAKSTRRKSKLAA